VSKLYIHISTKIFSYKITGTSSTPAVVAASRPTFAVVSVGITSPFGHPNPEVVGRWRERGAEILTTGERGTITISADREYLRVETFVSNP
jgi:beta-lactamase superfamily II metal-dependent hydrolase